VNLIQHYLRPIRAVEREGKGVSYLGPAVSQGPRNPSKWCFSVKGPVRQRSSPGPQTGSQRACSHYLSPMKQSLSQCKNPCKQISAQKQCMLVELCQRKLGGLVIMFHRVLIIDTLCYLWNSTSSILTVTHQGAACDTGSVRYSQHTLWTDNKEDRPTC